MVTILKQHEQLTNELKPTLDHYWDTTELPDDLTDEQLDMLIAKTEKAAREENAMRKKFKKSK